MTSPAVFVRLLSDDNKDDALLQALTALHGGRQSANVYSVEQSAFTSVPGNPFCYWASSKALSLFTTNPSLEYVGFNARKGLDTNDDFRFFRLAWETPLTHNGYVYVAKGGPFARYYSDLHLMIDWSNQGQTLRDSIRARGDHPSRNIRSEDKYFKPGLTWSQRSQAGLSVRVLPQGCIFSTKGPAVIPDNEGSYSIMTYLGLLNSLAYRSLVQLQMAFRSFDVGVMQRTPIPNFIDSNSAHGTRLQELASDCVRIKRALDTANETSPVFRACALLQVNGKTLSAKARAWHEYVSRAEKSVDLNQKAIDDYSFAAYDIADEDRKVMEEFAAGGSDILRNLDERDQIDDEADEREPATAPIDDLLSYCLGTVLGKWDVRIGKNHALASEPADAFDHLPICPPGTLTEDAALVGKDGPLPYRPDRLLAAPEHVPADYPLPVQWSGILVDDEGHPDDLVARVRGALAYLFGPEHAPAIEAEAIALLQEGGVKVKGLRDYYATRFFGTHIKRYSKSRRKAPIYWQLASRRKGYSLWLYYHRLHAGTLYQALQEYVEPKIELEQTRLRELEAQWRAATDSRAARTLAGQVDKKVALVEELIQFGNDLKEAADRGFAPDLNDGVILNIAPLHKLVPWPDAATAWTELTAGKYPWSTIGQRLAESHT